VARKSPITVFKHNGCGGCREILPIIRKLAKKRGIPVKVVDLEKCKTKKCNSLGYVPYIEYNHKEIKTSKELAEVLGVEKR
jgi:thiol-disulfide isomerase/thioredoxin